MRETTGKTTLLLMSEYGREAVRAVQTAQFSIEIIAYEWHFGDVPLGSPLFYFNNEIKNAVKRRVGVRALVRFESTANRLRKEGISAKVYNKKNLLHPKILIFDRVKVFCGSHNLTRAGMSSNVEISTETHDKEVAERAIKFFEDIWQ